MSDTHRLVCQLRHELDEFVLDVDLDLRLDGVTGLFGPSGAGKSTLLRSIAGFEKEARGAVRFAGTVWQDGRTFVPPHRRPVGFVFQDTRLFDHLTARGNLGFARDRAGPSAAIAFDDVVESLDLGPLLDRAVGGLSGGERQRVAMGRTLLSQPALLLLDEPLAALDAARKQDILPYLEAMPARFGVPSIYVSHAVDEMARLADHVIVLDAGRTVATGAAADILGRADLGVDGPGYEAINLLDVVVVSHDGSLGLTQVDFAGQPLRVPGVPGASPGDRARLVVRASEVVLATEAPSGISVRSVLAGTVTAIETVADSAFAMVSVDLGEALLKARLTRHAIQELGLEQGRKVFALIKAAAFDHSAG